MSVTDEPTEPTEPTDVEQAIGQIESRAGAIRAEQLDRALSQLDADGELSDVQRAAVERLSQRLIERLLATPKNSLRAAARRGDDEAVAAAMAMFGEE